jgi:hypothetical protein
MLPSDPELVGRDENTAATAEKSDSRGPGRVGGGWGGWGESV